MNIIPSGLKRGLEMIGACLSMLYRATVQGNTEVADACWRVIQIWVNEAFIVGDNGRKITLKSFGLAVLFGADPFQQSRAAWREVEAQFKNA